MSRRIIRRFAVALVAAPLVMLGSAGSADAGVSWDRKAPASAPAQTVDKAAPSPTANGVSWD